jgi:hypothetical protein
MGSTTRRPPVIKDPAPLVCIGRRRDRYGRPEPGRGGQPHGQVLMPFDDEWLPDLEARAWAVGWALGPVPKHPGRARSVMCPDCRHSGAVAAVASPPAGSVELAAS